MLTAMSLLYPDVFLSISWPLDLEMERASSDNEFFKELLLGSKTKLRIGEARGLFFFFIFLLRCILGTPRYRDRRRWGSETSL